MPDVHESNLEWFIANQDALVRQFNGRILILFERSVFGDFSNYLEAYVHASARLVPGTFTVQRCVPGEDAYTVSLYIEQSACQLAGFTPGGRIYSH